MFIDSSALVIVSNHDRPGGPSCDHPTRVIRHRQMYIEANFLAVMSTIACYPQRQNNGARGELLYLSTVELNDAGGVFASKLLSAWRRRVGG